MLLLKSNGKRGGEVKASGAGGPSFLLPLTACFLSNETPEHSCGLSQCGQRATEVCCTLSGLVLNNRAGVWSADASTHSVAKNDRGGHFISVGAGRPQDRGKQGTPGPVSFSAHDQSHSSYVAAEMLRMWLPIPAVFHGREKCHPSGSIFPCPAFPAFSNEAGGLARTGGTGAENYVELRRLREAVRGKTAEKEKPARAQSSQQRISHWGCQG